MNLTEDKKAPLRKKDYRMQKDMVAQWLNKTTTGTVHTNIIHLFLPTNS